jgi:hypothetical protein
MMKLAAFVRFYYDMMGFIRGSNASRIKIFFEIGNIFESDIFTTNDLMEPKIRKLPQQNKVKQLPPL